jgi:hypothetical protein
VIRYTKDKTNLSSSQDDNSSSRSLPVIGIYKETNNSGIKPAAAGEISFFNIRLQADISAAGIRAGQEKLIALWYILRSINLSGSGVIDKDCAIELLMREFNYARATAYAYLRAGEGLYWQSVDASGRARIAIYGLSRVLVCMGLNKATDSHWREVSQAKFNTPGQRRAELYASCLKPDEVKGNPISRASITQFTGLSKSAQRRREIEGKGIKRVANFAKNMDGDPISATYEAKSKAYHMQQRLPNSYRTKQAPSNKGQIKKAFKRAARSLLAREAQSTLKKVFFKGPRKAIKAIEHDSQGVHTAYYKERPTKRTIYGRQEWVLLEYGNFAPQYRLPRLPMRMGFDVSVIKAN